MELEEESAKWWLVFAWVVQQLKVGVQWATVCQLAKHLAIKE